MAKKVGCPKGYVEAWKEDMTRKICIPIVWTTTAELDNQKKAMRVSKKLKEVGIESKIKKKTVYEIQTSWHFEDRVRKIAYGR